MPTKIVTIASQKGGVGKTTFTVNLGAGLALAGRQVLLLDFDAQGGLAAMLNVPGSSGAYELLRQPILDSPAVQQFIHSLVVDTGRENLWVLPGDKMTEDAEGYIKHQPWDYIANSLKVFDGLGLDYIIIDTSPSIGGIQEMAIFASDFLLIPTHPKHLSLRGMKLLLDDVQALREGREFLVENGRGQKRRQYLSWGGKLLGIVINEYMENRVMSQKARALLEENFPESLLPPVHRAEAFLSCEDDGLTIFEKYPRSRAASEMQVLVDLILRAR